jgi:hypothetical protein
MPIKDILLPLVGEPSAAAITAIDNCVGMAKRIGARVSALAIEVDIPVRPRVTISDDLDNTEVAISVRSVLDAKGLLKAFDAAATKFEVRNEQKVKRLVAADIAGGLAETSRLKGSDAGSAETA